MTSQLPVQVTGLPARSVTPAGGHGQGRRRALGLALAALLSTSSADLWAQSGTAILSDTFNRPDQSGLGTADTGQSWLSYFGSAFVAADQGHLGGFFTLMAVNSGVSTGDVSVRVVQPTAEFWLVFRLTDGGNYWRFGRWAGEPYQMQVVRNHTLDAPGVETLVSQQASAGDVITCRLRDAVMECAVNGVLVARTSDAYNRHATLVGLSSSQGAGAHFDDFLVGPPPPSPDLSVTVAGPGMVDAGQSISWVVTVRNDGSAASPAVGMSVTVPSGTTGATVSGLPCSGSATGYLCALDALQPGATRLLNLSAGAPQSAGPIQLRAEVDLAPGETITANNESHRVTNVRPPGSGAVVVFDEFTRPDAPDLGIADSGQQWTTHYGSATVSGLRAVLGGYFTLATLNSGIDESDVSVSVVQPTSEYWLVFRFSDGGNYWRFGRWAGEPYQLQRIRSHTIDAPGVETLVSRTAAAGDLLSCELRDSGIACSVDGVVVARTTDSFNRTATSVGLSSSQSAGGHFEDFLVSEPPPAPDLVASVKGPAMLTAGTAGTWTATVTNAGTASSPATNLIVTVPAAFSGVSVSGASCTSSGNVYTCQIGALSIGEHRAVTIQASAPPSVGSHEFLGHAVPVPGEPTTLNNDSARITTLRPIGAPPFAVFDEFERPDSQTLGVAGSGQVWATHYGVATVASERAALGGYFTLTSVNAGIAASDVVVTVTEPTAEFWLVFRFADAGNYWRFGRWAGEPYMMQRVRAHTLGAPGVETLATVQPAAGDVLRCELRDSGITCSVNSTLVARTADPFNRTATSVGLSSSQHAGGHFDDLMVSAAPPAPDLSVSASGPAMLTVGAAGTWTVTVRNVGTAASVPGVVSIAVPSALENVSVGGASCGAVGDTYECAVGGLSPAQATTVTIQANAPQTEGTIELVASMSATTGEGSVLNNQGVRKTTVRPLGAPAIWVLDEFARPDRLDLGTADTGQEWVRFYGWAIVTAEQAVLQDSFTLVGLDAGTAASDVSVTVVEPSAEFFLVFRLTDGGNYWRFGRSSNGPYRLQRIKDHVLEAPGVETLTDAYAVPGEVISCRVRHITLECFAGSTLVARTNDPFNRTATWVGLSSAQSAGGQFDDLMVLAPPPAPDLRLSVAASSWLLPGELQDLRLQVQNVGEVAADSAAIAIAISSGLTVSSPIPSGCTSGGAHITCIVPPLAAGQVYSVSIGATTHVAGEYGSQAWLHGLNAPEIPWETVEWSTTVRANSAGVSDRFSRPDTTSGLGQSANGQTWQVLQGNFRIANREATTTATGSLAVIDRGYPFGTLDVTLGAGAASAVILFRVTDANNYYRLSTDSEGFYWYTKVVDGVVQPGQYQIRQRFVKPQTGDRVRIVVRPDDGIFIAVNGAHVLDGGDTHDMYATGWGLSSTANAPVSYREFVLRPEMESFETVDGFDQMSGSVLNKPAQGVLYHWVNWIGTYWTSVANQARPNETGYSYTAIEISTELATAKVTLKEPGTAGWLVFRHTEDGTYYRFGHQAGLYHVGRVVQHSDQAMPVPVQHLASVAPQAGDALEVRQGPDGTVECLVNGVVVLRFVDPVNSVRATAYGLAAVGTDTAFDDFVVTPPTWR